MDSDENTTLGTAPTRVAIYELTTAGEERVAEFRRTAGTVELTLSEPDVCPLAQDWYAKGIRIPGNPKPITTDDAPAFMRALLQPFRLSYCRIVDESDPNPTPWSVAGDAPRE